MSGPPLVLAEEMLVAIAMGGAILITIVAFVLMTISKLVKNSQRERTRREIAAYVAEGSIQPEEGERLMRAAANEPKDS